MNIVADQVMIDASAAFGTLGNLRLVDGRRLGPADVAEADVLLVRSVTRVGQALLEGSRVRFVGTATAGTDHIDLDYLASRQIAFTAATGCNAQAVGEYVLACALAFAEARGRLSAELTCGLIGCGHAGSAAERLLVTAGFTCLRHDPLRAEAEGSAGFTGLEETLKADIVSLHVPLTSNELHYTRGLLDRKAFATMRDGALLINAARGGIVDEQAWQAELAAGRLLGAIDCWVGEPVVGSALLAAAWVATPHIAGHSVDARQRATAQVRAGLLQWQGHAKAVIGLPALENAPPFEITNLPGPGAVRAAVERCVNPLAMTVDFRSMMLADEARAGSLFDELRAQFGVRREFMGQPVALQEADPDTAALLQRLGFPVGVL
jgi:erythronate-4-phosphate dehydrogenase